MGTKFLNLCYMDIYNMLRTIHSPTLESILLVEEAIRRNSGACGKYQVWKKLPRQMMYQTFQTILKYLQDSGKIIIDKHGKLIWIHNPRLIRRILAQGVRMR